MKRAQLQTIHEFELLKMTEGEKVISYCSRTMEICNKRFHEETMFDVAIVETILRSPAQDLIMLCVQLNNPRTQKT